MYSAGEAAEFTVTNSGSAPVFVSGCGALQLEHFESEHYLPVRAETCVSEGTALEIAPGTQTLTLAPSGRLPSASVGATASRRRQGPAYRRKRASSQVRPPRRSLVTTQSVTPSSGNSSASGMKMRLTFARPATSSRSPGSATKL
jgi:hypothetical protein